MNDTIYQSATLFAVSGWLLLIVGMFVPTTNPWRAHLLLAAGRVIPLALASAYAVLLVRGLEPVGASGSAFERVSAMFQVPAMVLVGWVHFLTFDLFVGRWIVDDAETRNIKAWWLLPSLILAFLYGPTGLLLYFAVRGIKGIAKVSGAAVGS